MQKKDVKLKEPSRKEKRKKTLRRKERSNQNHCGFVEKKKGFNGEEEDPTKARKRVRISKKLELKEGMGLLKGTFCKTPGAI